MVSCTCSGGTTTHRRAIAECGARRSGCAAPLGWPRPVRKGALRRAKGRRSLDPNTIRQQAKPRVRLANDTTFHIRLHVARARLDAAERARYAEKIANLGCFSLAEQEIGVLVVLASKLLRGRPELWAHLPSVNDGGLMPEDSVDWVDMRRS